MRDLVLWLLRLGESLWFALTCQTEVTQNLVYR